VRRVFLDANFLVAAGFSPDGDYRKWVFSSEDTFVTSEHVLGEVDRNPGRLQVDAWDWCTYVRRRFEITYRFEVLPVGLPLVGAGDRQALSEAIGAACDLFVTSDTDFDALFGQRIKGTLVVKSGLYVRGLV
jgi:predicted nucleic acid-binding protein